MRKRVEVTSAIFVWHLLAIAPLGIWKMAELYFGIFKWLLNF